MVVIRPDDVEEALSQIQEAIDRREPFQLIYRIQTVTGEEKWVLERGQGIYSVFSSDNELVTLEGFVFDITEQRHAEEARESLLTLQRELDVASRIQQSMLPQTFPTRPDLDIHAKMIPAKSVGGDFYDFFFLDDDRLGIVIGDVSGKGVPAALYMSITRALMKSTAMTGLSAADCVGRVNQLLRGERLSHLFITLFYGIIDLRRGEVEFCNAGHNPPYHVSPKAQPRPLDEPSGIVLGVVDQAEYHAGHLRLEAGDGLFLYTDGITEAMDASQTMYGEDRLCSRLEGGGGAQQRVDAVLEDLRQYSHGVVQSDDITALAVFLG